MHCPACHTELKMADRQGVEIDYCPRCRGVWLDRGELDKIIERAAADRPSAATSEGRWRGYARDEARDSRWDDDDDERDPYKRRRRKSFLGELFDFD
jgi:Zn-finger nucleic acid-binding protein